MVRDVISSSVLRAISIRAPPAIQMPFQISPDKSAELPGNSNTDNRPAGKK